jgi:hypothetical protein
MLNPCFIRIGETESERPQDLRDNFMDFTQGNLFCIVLLADGLFTS